MPGPVDVLIGLHVYINQLDRSVSPVDVLAD